MASESELPPGCTGPHAYADGALFCIKDASGADYVWGATHPGAATRSAWAQYARMHGRGKKTEERIQGCAKAIDRIVEVAWASMHEDSPADLASLNCVEADENDKPTDDPAKMVRCAWVFMGNVAAAPVAAVLGETPATSGLPTMEEAHEAGLCGKFGDGYFAGERIEDVNAELAATAPPRPGEPTQGGE